MLMGALLIHLTGGRIETLPRLRIAGVSGLLSRLAGAGAGDVVVAGIIIRGAFWPGLQVVVASQWR